MRFPKSKASNRCHFCKNQIVKERSRPADRRPPAGLPLWAEAGLVRPGNAHRHKTNTASYHSRPPPTTKILGDRETVNISTLPNAVKRTSPSLFDLRLGLQRGQIRQRPTCPAKSYKNTLSKTAENNVVSRSPFPELRAANQAGPRAARRIRSQITLPEEPTRGGECRPPGTRTVSPRSCDLSPVADWKTRLELAASSAQTIAPHPRKKPLSAKRNIYDCGATGKLLK